MLYKIVETPLLINLFKMWLILKVEIKVYLQSWIFIILFDLYKCYCIFIILVPEKLLSIKQKLNGYFNKKFK